MVNSRPSVPHKSNGIMMILAAKYTFVLCQTTKRKERICQWSSLFLSQMEFDNLLTRSSSHYHFNRPKKCK